MTTTTNDLVEAIKKSRVACNGCFDPQEKSNSSIITRDFLASQWKLATQDLQAIAVIVTQQQQDPSAVLLSEWFDRIYNMHAEKTRHYHTPVHLEEMCRYLQLFVEHDNIQDVETTRKTLLLAIFFHDAVYNAQSATNEEDSAKLFESFADQVKMSSERKQTIVEYILATKQHKVSHDNPFNLSLFLDLDMAVLGKTESAYQQYAALIRNEYNFVPHDEYCQKRAQVLETFLQEQDRIYGTNVMHAALEQQARSNIQNEIDLLSKGTIPEV